MLFSMRKMLTLIMLICLAFGLCLDLSSASASGIHQSPAHHHCNHGHDGHQHHPHHGDNSFVGSKLPEELAEEEDMRLYGFGFQIDEHDHDHDIVRPELSGLGEPSIDLCF